MRAGERMRTWHPRVPGVREVLHADFVEHAYPPHTHEEWTLLLIDSGEVAYALDGSARRAPAGTVSLLPPDVAHDGRSARDGGFRKRVLYLEPGWLPSAVSGRAVDAPVLRELAPAVRSLHRALAGPDVLAAEQLLLGIRRRALTALGGAAGAASSAPGVAAALRELLDDRVVDGITLAEAARLLAVHPATLSRTFVAAFGISPHRYLVGRRVDRARHLLVDGWPPADAATASGFFDQAHLTRHFARTLGVTPGEYARGRSAA